MHWIKGYSVIIQAISLTWVSYGIHKRCNPYRLFRYLLSGVLLTLVGMLTLPAQPNAILLYVGTLFVCFYKKGEKLSVLQGSLQAVLFLYMMIVFFGSPFLYFYPEWQENRLYQFLMGCILLFGSGIYSVMLQNKSPVIQKLCRKPLFCLILMESFVLLFFSLILPRFHLENLRLYYLSQWCFMIFLWFLWGLMRWYSHLEQENALLRLKVQQRKVIKQEYYTMIQLKHYMLHLLEGFLPHFRRRDLAGAIGYFNEYVHPIREEHFKSKEYEKIHNTLLLVFLESAMNRSLVLEVDLEAQIVGEIMIDQQVEMEVFQILSEWLNNGLEALQKQKHAHHRRLHIEMSQQKSYTRFVLRNRIEPTLHREKPSKRKGRGYGLEWTKEIICKNPRFSSSTEIRDGYYIQCLLVEHQIGGKHYGDKCT